MFCLKHLGPRDLSTLCPWHSGGSIKMLEDAESGSEGSMLCMRHERQCALGSECCSERLGACSMCSIMQVS